MLEAWDAWSFLNWVFVFEFLHGVTLNLVEFGKRMVQPVSARKLFWKTLKNPQKKNTFDGVLCLRNCRHKPKTILKKGSIAAACRLPAFAKTGIMYKAYRAASGMLRECFGKLHQACNQIQKRITNFVEGDSKNLQMTSAWTTHKMEEQHIKWKKSII